MGSGSFVRAPVARTWRRSRGARSTSQGGTHATRSLEFDMTTPTFDDTIAAIATAPGAAGLAVVRLSGRDAIAIADRVFRAPAALAGATSHTLHHGWAVACDPQANGGAEGAMAARPTHGAT